MSLTDVAGIFSRYFVIGFFLPSFFVLVAVSQALTNSFLPPVYLDASNGTRIAILGGAALLVGLVLLGLSYQILRLFQGYPVRGHFGRGQKRRLAELRQEIADSESDKVKQRNAKWRLDRAFRSDTDHVLPTRLGNVICAFERHSMLRWGLNAIAAWPRIELLLSDGERQAHSDVKGNLSFFLNASLLAILAGGVLLADEIVNHPMDSPAAVLYGAPFLVGALCYRASIGAAIEWGEAVRSSIDLHRLELYDRIGLRVPNGFVDEHDNVAPALNAALLRGEAIPDELVATFVTQPTDDSATDDADEFVNLRMANNSGEVAEVRVGKLVLSFGPKTHGERAS